MKVMSVTLILVSIILAWSASAEGRSADQHGAYPYCNVYADIACFGIANGDQVTMSLPADFLVYDFKLNGGVVGTIYVGNHANISDAPFRKEVEECVDSERRCNFVSHENSGIWAIYVNESGTQLELRIRGLEDSQGARARDFISGFRACTTQSGGITCKPESMFVERGNP